MVYANKACRCLYKTMCQIGLNAQLCIMIFLKRISSLKTTIVYEYSTCVKVFRTIPEFRILLLIFNRIQDFVADF